LRKLIHSRHFALIGCIFVNLDDLVYAKGYWPVHCASLSPCSALLQLWEHSRGDSELSAGEISAWFPAKRLRGVYDLQFAGGALTSSADNLVSRRSVRLIQTLTDLTILPVSAFIGLIRGITHTCVPHVNCMLAQRSLVI